MGDEKILLKTTRFGDIEVATSSFIDLFAGLIGFPQYRNFVLLEYTPPFSWLQSVERPELAFVVVNAAEFGDEYSFNLPDGDRELDIRPDDDVAVFNLVSIRPDPATSTVNLKAPVIVNLRNRKGRQMILDDPRFPTRMTLWVGPEDKQKKPE
jgi:flagellar assembly factor FliW